MLLAQTSRILKEAVASERFGNGSLTINNDDTTPFSATSTSIE
jgi:hypothetical protein